MRTRLVIMEVKDVQTQDDIEIAIGAWNQGNPDREIKIIQQTSIIVGEER